MSDQTTKPKTEENTKTVVDLASAVQTKSPATFPTFWMQYDETTEEEPGLVPDPDWDKDITLTAEKKPQITEQKTQPVLDLNIEELNKFGTMLTSGNPQQKKIAEEMLTQAFDFFHFNLQKQGENFKIMDDAKPDLELVKTFVVLLYKLGLAGQQLKKPSAAMDLYEAELLAEKYGIPPPEKIAATSTPKTLTSSTGTNHKDLAQQINLLVQGTKAEQEGARKILTAALPKLLKEFNESHALLTTLQQMGDITPKLDFIKEIASLSYNIGIIETFLGKKPSKHIAYAIELATKYNLQGIKPAEKEKSECSKHKLK